MTCPAFATRIDSTYAQTLSQLTVMQLNITHACNLACNHCHHECGPQNTEFMTRENLALALDIFERDGFQTLDITGGAPELHPDFEWLITEASRRSIHTLVRTNLAVLKKQPYAHLPEVYAQLGVELVASLPCYTQQNVDAQRGVGTFEIDTAELKILNGLGYAMPDSGLILNLVYNPGGAFLPGGQAALEHDYHEKLGELSIAFSHLFTITNMPIGRFKNQLETAQATTAYRTLLEDNFNEATLANMMCRSQISIGPDGTLYDCDFNQALHLPIDKTLPQNIADYRTRPLGTRARTIVFGDHCYACTAGAGSSCTGETA